MRKRKLEQDETHRLLLEEDGATRSARLLWLHALAVAGVLLVLALALGGSAAQAATVVIDGGIEFSGDSAPSDISFEFTIDPGQPDEDPSVGLYLSTGSGSYDGFFDALGGIVLVGVMDQISSDSGVGVWQADFTIDFSGFLVPVNVSLNGVGLLGDQSLPLFTSFTDGTITANATSLGIGIGYGTVQFFAVPEPHTALLVALGLVGLGLRRSR